MTTATDSQSIMCKHETLFIIDKNFTVTSLREACEIYIALAHLSLDLYFMFHFGGDNEVFYVNRKYLHFMCFIQFSLYFTFISYYSTSTDLQSILKTT